MPHQAAPTKAVRLTTQKTKSSRPTKSKQSQAQPKTWADEEFEAFLQNLEAGLDHCSSPVSSPSKSAAVDDLEAYVKDLEAGLDEPSSSPQHESEMESYMREMEAALEMDALQTEPPQVPASPHQPHSPPAREASPAAASSPYGDLFSPGPDSDDDADVPDGTGEDPESSTQTGTAPLTSEPSPANHGLCLPSSNNATTVLAGPVSGPAPHFLPSAHPQTAQVIPPGEKSNGSSREAGPPKPSAKALGKKKAVDGSLPGAVGSVPTASSGRGPGSQLPAAMLGQVGRWRPTQPSMKVPENRTAGDDSNATEGPLFNAAPEGRQVPSSITARAGWSASQPFIQAGDKRKAEEPIGDHQDVAADPTASGKVVKKRKTTSSRRTEKCPYCDKMFVSVVDHLSNNKKCQKANQFGIQQSSNGPSVPASRASAHSTPPQCGQPVALATMARHYLGSQENPRCPPGQYIFIYHLRVPVHILDDALQNVISEDLRLVGVVQDAITGQYFSVPTLGTPYAPLASPAGPQFSKYMLDPVSGVFSIAMIAELPAGDVMTQQATSSVQQAPFVPENPNFTFQAPADCYGPQFQQAVSSQGFPMGAPVYFNGAQGPAYWDSNAQSMSMLQGQGTHDVPFEMIDEV